jgi:hypothetical protein
MPCRSRHLHFGLFKAIRTPSWRRSVSGRSPSDYAKNAEVFIQGAQANSVFYIQEGRVKVTVTSDQGKEAIVAILETGQFLVKVVSVAKATGLPRQKR